MKFSRIILWSIVGIGLYLRFHVQFLEPFFNNDEIDLGMNINQRGFLDLLKPLKHYQTAPPLFLWLMRCVYLIPVGATWFKYKLFFFLLNIPFIYLVYDLIKRFSKDPIVQIVALAMVCLNPFFIYHGLTLKQYLLDAIIVMLLVKSEFKSEAKWGYKILWILAPVLSNPVLFVYTGFLLKSFYKQLKCERNLGLSWGKSLFNSIMVFLKTALYRWFYLPLFVYVVYFAWYTQQDGYLTLTRFMWDFWRLTFFSNPHDFFIRIYYFFIGNITFIFSHDKTLANLGTVLFFIGLIRFYRKKRDDISRFQLGVYMAAIGVFVTLNFLKMYPIAPRLLLFFSPVVVLLIALSGEIKHVVYRSLWIVLVLIGLGNYFLYFPFKENDVLEMTKRLDVLKPHSAYFSMNSTRAIRKFDAFTENEFRVENNYLNVSSATTGVDSVFVLKLVHQYGRNGENGPIMEPCIPRAAESGRMELISVADGFNIYRINDPNIISEFVKEGILHPNYLTENTLDLPQNPFFTF